VSAYKYRTVGFTNATSSTNRWVVRREAETFDRGFNAIRLRNLEVARRLGLDTDGQAWPEVLSRMIIEHAVTGLTRNEDELVIADVDGSPRLIPRSVARATKALQHVVHLHIVGPLPDREVLLQKRSIRKTQYGGMIDVSVAGHQHSTDWRRESAREAAEELGIWLDLASPVTPRARVGPLTRKLRATGKECCRHTSGISLLHRVSALTSNRQPIRPAPYGCASIRGVSTVQRREPSGRRGRRE